VAARSAGAAAGDAGDRVLEPRIGEVGRISRRRVPQGIERTRTSRDKIWQFQYRWAEGDYSQLPALAADLVNRKVAGLAVAFLPATVAAKAATSIIPIWQCFTVGEKASRT
jgi:hypothetical protein